MRKELKKWPIGIICFCNIELPMSAKHIKMGIQDMTKAWLLLLLLFI